MEPIQPAYIPVNLCFAANENYVGHLATALYSVLKNRDTGRLYDVLILHKDISEESQKRILDMEKEGNVVIRFISMEPYEKLVAYDVGAYYSNETGATYKVTGTNSKQPTVMYVSSNKTKNASVIISSSIEVNGVKYLVTSIADDAFRNNKKLKKITIGKEIISIGKRAFEGCKNLKIIVIQTEKLKTKTVGRKAFSKTSSKAVVEVPKKKLKAYKKLLRKRGLSKKAAFKTK